VEKKNNQLLASCETTFSSILGLLKKKNSDYAGEADTYKNFTDPELQAFLDKHNTGLDAVELGIRIRLKDKWARINTLLFSNKPPAVIDESLDDTLSDVIGYAAIWKAWRENKKSAPNSLNLRPGSFTSIPYKAYPAQFLAMCKCEHPLGRHQRYTNGTFISDCADCDCKEYEREAI